MSTKRIIDKEYKFDLHRDQYSTGFTIGMIISCKELLPTDKITSLNDETREYAGWGSGPEDEGKTYSQPVITITRREMESDQDYFDRMKKEENFKKSTEERERLEYLRLKAKFES